MAESEDERIEFYVCYDQTHIDRGALYDESLPIAVVLNRPFYSCRNFHRILSLDWTGGTAKVPRSC